MKTNAGRDDVTTVERFSEIITKSELETQQFENLCRQSIDTVRIDFKHYLEVIYLNCKLYNFKNICISLFVNNTYKIYVLFVHLTKTGLGSGLIFILLNVLRRFAIKIPISRDVDKLVKSYVMLIDTFSANRLRQYLFAQLLTVKF